MGSRGNSKEGTDNKYDLRKRTKLTIYIIPPGLIVIALLALNSKSATIVSPVLPSFVITSLRVRPPVINLYFVMKAFLVVSPVVSFTS